ncbi:MAG: Asp-tRNA(Asn)/Glu-tRNA(Gln) amidotransferase subunit GatB [bacterium]|nr:Asp-tRNA(Asn)/Glu-tRNA(Gln) amidotransferase subunit GatB [bacterium]
MMSDTRECIIGLEVHAQLMTRSKIFCGCEVASDAEPNTLTCPVCLGLPGALPVLNRRAVELTARLGLALGCRVNTRSVMARKHYAYPDLPKGYQITQYAQPLCEGGGLTITTSTGERRIGIARIHIEDDAGKSVHGENGSLIDLNRCGVPLAEIVTEPALRHPAEARAWLRELHLLLVRLGICDGNMELGSLRCDVNVSLRLRGESTLGPKTEIKNLNSFRNVERALEREIARQEGILKSGGCVVSETLLWDAAAGEVLPLRSKEGSHDYRYFPEPDLPPIVVEEMLLQRLVKEMPELPAACRNRLRSEYDLDKQAARLIADDAGLTVYFETLCAAGVEPTRALRWLRGEILHRLGGCEITTFGVSPTALAELLELEATERITTTSAVRILDWMLTEGGCAGDGLRALDLESIAAGAHLDELVQRTLADHPHKVERYRSGERRLFGFFMGCVMTASSGRANPTELRRLLAIHLD